MYDIKYGRKTRGIKLQLRKKLDDWANTIKNRDVQQLVKKHTIVTGGSIASMLMGERINDYDIYFRNRETALAVARYYVEEFNSTVALSSTNNYKPQVREETRKNIRGEKENRVLIWMQSAGIAAENQDDYEYFETLPENETIEFAESISQDSDEANKPPYRPVFMSENAITLSDQVQLVIRFFGEPDEIHKNYDFIHATCSYDWAQDKLVTPEKALLSMMSRTLQYQGSLYPVASIFRMKKFIERGWRITAGEQLKIMWQISEITLSCRDTLREQLIGVDMAYMWQLIKALQDVATDQINSAYVAAIIDRIFD